MNIKEIEGKWYTEKDCYREQELGTGVHSFVKSCLESDELFSLKEALLSTKLDTRHNVYVHENKAKEGRRADFVIYIDQDVVIPLEAERYGNIKAGAQQLFAYQKDFKKNYGILTDGFTWRFYNNNIYRIFTLKQIFEDPSPFITFWKEYIKPDSYYLAFFEPRGQLSLLREIDVLDVDSKRQIFFEDITKLISTFGNKLKVEGYFDGLEKKERSKKAVEITYAYIIQFILYKTLVDNDFGNFGNEFNDIVEAIHKCLKVKQYGKILGIIEGISNAISENVYRPFKEEQTFINETVMGLIRKPENELHDVSPWLDIFIFIKKFNFANIQNEIFGYIYENYLKVLYEDSKKGQYFTDPAIVNFMLHQIGYDSETVSARYGEDKNSISLIDPSCGSGTFLYSAVDSIIKSLGNGSIKKSDEINEVISNNVFGLDIAEFPLYLAEMNIIMRLLPMIINEKYNNPVDKKVKIFMTKDSIAEFLNTALWNTQHDIDMKAGQLRLDFHSLDFEYKSYVRKENDLVDMKQSLENQQSIPRRRFDFVVGNPPYISFNDCAKQKLMSFDYMKRKKLKLSDIYGVNLHSAPDRQKKYPPKPNLYAFFIALGLALLKDNGKLCYIIPQTLITESDYDVMRYHLSKYTTIEKIITFKGKMFIGRGIRQDKPVTTSSLIFIVDKAIPKENHKVKIINHTQKDEDVETCLNDILTGKHITIKQVNQKALLDNVGNWSAIIKHGKVFNEFLDEYNANNESISLYYDHAIAESHFGDRFYFDVGYILNNKYVSDTPTDDCFELIDFNAFEGYSKYNPSSYYPNDRKKIQLPKNSQGYVTLEQKYKIIWNKVYSKEYHFTDRRILPSMSYCQIISSNNKKETLYLFSLLDSPLNKYIFQELFQVDNEQYGSFLVVKRIKEFIRVPIITKHNTAVKNEIIKYTNKIIELEEKVLSDYVDFNNIMIQKFEKVSIDGSSLVLQHNDKVIRIPIKGSTQSIKETIDENYNAKLAEEKFSLRELKALSVIDFDKRTKYKEYINDLIFALYFGIGIKTPSFVESDNIHKLCSNNQFYIHS